MNRKVLGMAAAIATLGTAVPASACTSVQQQVTIHPVSQEEPKTGEAGIGTVFKIHFSGDRSGELNKLWPNYYVVEVIEGEKKGQKP